MEDREGPRFAARDCCVSLTENFCVPTQWVVIDASQGQLATKWIEKLPESKGIIDLIRVTLPVKEEETSDVQLKEDYFKIRPRILAHLQSAFNHRRQGGVGLKGSSRGIGSRGRLVVWVVAHISDDAGGMLLENLPIDITNLIHWKLGLKPVIFRCAIGGNQQQKNCFLNLLQRQYFAPKPAEVPPSPSKGVKGMTRHHFRDNDYDSCLLVGDLNCFYVLLKRLVMLHAQELSIIRRQAKQTPINPGEVIIMDPTTRWRCINWLVAARPESFPRLWHVERDRDLDDTRLLLSHLDGVAKNEDRLEVKREKDWSNLHLVEEVYQRPLDLGEEDEWRITPTDERTRRELILYLQRVELFELSLRQILKARKEEAMSLIITTRGGPTINFLPPLYLKLEGRALLNVGKEDEAKVLLRRYTDYLRQQEVVTELPVMKLGEIANVSLNEKNFPVAREYALKALEREKHYLPAYKTLVWISQQTGVSTHQQEEHVYAYFAHILHDANQGEAHYQKVTQQWPRNHLAWAFYATFLAETKGNWKEAEASFRQAISCVEQNERDQMQTSNGNMYPLVTSKDEGWLFGSFATFLHQIYNKEQSKQQESETQFSLSLSGGGGMSSLSLSGVRDNERLSTEVEKCYLRALTVDPNNMVWMVNMASFELSSDQNHRRKNGMELLARLISRLDEGEVGSADVAAESWFYQFCHGETSEQLEALRKLKSCILSGNRAYGWDFSPHLRIAIQEGHEAKEWLSTLAGVLSHEKEKEVLDAWPAWRMAGAQIPVGDETPILAASPPDTTDDTTIPTDNNNINNSTPTKPARTAMDLDLIEDDMGWGGGSQGSQEEKRSVVDVFAFDEGDEFSSPGKNKRSFNAVKDGEKEAPNTPTKKVQPDPMLISPRGKTTPVKRLRGVRRKPQSEAASPPPTTTTTPTKGRGRGTRAATRGRGRGRARGAAARRARGGDDEEEEEMELGPLPSNPAGRAEFLFTMADDEEESD